MPTLKTVLFDLDNTLINWMNIAPDWRARELRHVTFLYDFVHDNGAVLNGELAVVHEHFSRSVRDAWAESRSTLRAPHIGSIMMDTLTHFGMSQSEALSMNACMDAYRWGGIDGVTVFPDVPPLLETLRQHGVEIGIVTNAFQPSTMRDLELRDYDLLRHFPASHTRITAADVGYLKPHPFIFQHALEALATTAAETVFVGDNLVADIGGAQKMGMKAVLRVLTANTGLSQLIQPDASLSDLGDLPAVLDEWYPGWR